MIIMLDAVFFDLIHSPRESWHGDASDVPIIEMEYDFELALSAVDLFGTLKHKIIAFLGCAAIILLGICTWWCQRTIEGKEVRCR